MFAHTKSKLSAVYSGFLNGNHIHLTKVAFHLPYFETATFTTINKWEFSGKQDGITFFSN